MGRPENGKYWIKLAADPKPLTGIDNKTGSHLLHVITGGSDDVFTIKRVADDKWIITLEEIGPVRYIRAHDRDVVGDMEPTVTLWMFSGPEEGPFAINVFNPTWVTQGWTVTKHDGKHPIALSLTEVPHPNQLFNLIPWPGPE